MNPIAADILEHLNCGNEIAEDILEHYGTKRHSGRYPWGSGDSPYQSSSDFYGRVQELKKNGMKETEIAEYFDMSTTELRAYTGVAKQQRWTLYSERARSLKEDGLSTYKIAEKMGVPESTVRLYLDDSAKDRMNAVTSAAKFIEKNIDEKGMIDIGVGVERQLNLTPDKMNQVIAILNADGYTVQGGGVQQATNKGKQTILRVACPPGTPNSAIYDYQNIHYLYDTSLDGINPGETSKTGFRFPESLDSNRLLIRLHDDVGPDGHTGVERDGVIQIRRGVPDLDLGNSNYAQVRIMVDGTHYLKGMAVYSDDIPDGYDCVFNSNKFEKSKALKELKRTPDGEIDRDNPFGSLIKEDGGQSTYIGKDGKEHLSLINKRADEGDWGEWGDKLPSQFLSKQSKKLIDQQLQLAIDDKVAEYNDICDLNNPTVKRKMLETFASDCDSAAVHLKAASLPRSKYQVILPIPDMKNDEIYAPNYDDGEKVALVRYPHGGTFEIPILTVNNKVESARNILGVNAKDAVGINAEVAGRLSGADFDGDTVMVIPTRGNGRNPKIDIVSTPPLKDLEGFDPTASYGGTKVVKEDGSVHYYRNGHEFKPMSKSLTQTEMGKVSNLITDMTLKGATSQELVRAVRHSMVVIDAEKHKLDYKQSERDNDISSLKARYQGYYSEDGSYHEGASTLISRAKSRKEVPKRKGNPNINPVTGEQTYDSIEYTDPKTGKKVIKPSKISGETYEEVSYKNENGKWVRAKGESLKQYYQDKKNGTNLDNYKVVVKTRMQDSTKMAETSDAFTLVSDYRSQEEIAYANYANKLKSMANDARKEMMATGRLKYDKDAAATYSEEVTSLMSKLRLAEMNAPRERQAQLLANAEIRAKKESNPDMTRKEEKKLAQQALVRARNKVGARRTTVDITDKEWAAIQKGAISDTTLVKIFNHTDADALRQRATPRAANELSTGQKTRIKNLLKMGYTNAQIAEAVGVSTSVVQTYSDPKKQVS